MKSIFKKLALAGLFFAALTHAKGEDTAVRQLYYSDITEWDATSATQKATTRFTGEEFTLTTSGDIVIDPKATSGKINLAANKSGSLEISALSSITTLEFEASVGRGGGNGWKVEALGDGDEDWVTLSEESLKSTTELKIDVNRSNVKLRFSNINSKKALYINHIKLLGKVPVDKVPALSSFIINGVSYTANEIFAEQTDGTMAGSVELSKTVAMISESNPLQDVTASVGTVKGTKYEGDATQCKVTLSVATASEETVYVLQVNQKCDFTLTYLDAEGVELGKQTVEKDAKIGKFAVDIPLAPECMEFRGWVYDNTTKQRVSTESVITSDLKLTAYFTMIEFADGASRHVYQLNNPLYNKEKLSTLGDQENYFFPEDHEGFNASVASYSAGGDYLGRTHGWLFKAGSTLDLLVGPDAYIKLNLCNKNSSDATIEMTGGQTIKAKGSEEQEALLHYVGEAGTVTLTFSADTYLHRVTVSNVADHPIRQEGGYYLVEAGNADQFLTVLELVNSQGGNAKIFLPNGTYDLGGTCLTPITGTNVSIIGQSMEGTIICNHPSEKNESINVTATLYNQSKNLYLQDLTIQNQLNYYRSGSAGRAVCLMERGSENTICKNVRLLSYQDTYYTYSGLTKNFYWEDSEIHGTVDYLCGGGNVVYNRVTLVNENRSNKTEPDGETTIAAPRADNYVDWGYVFLDCNVICHSKTFNLGRSWGGTSRLNYIRTTLQQPDRLYNKRFNEAGMNIAAYGFYEYGTKDADGNASCPESNVVKFTHSTGNKEYETILTDAEAEKYTIDNIFGDWHPDQTAAQKAISEGTFNATSLSWSGESDAYGVFVDNQFVAITAEKHFKLDADPAGATITVRAANGRGGFGQPVALTFSETSIDNISQENASSEQVFNLFGQQSAKCGLVVVNGKKFIYR